MYAIISESTISDFFDIVSFVILVLLKIWQSICDSASSRSKKQHIIANFRIVWFLYNGLFYSQWHSFTATLFGFQFPQKSEISSLSWEIMSHSLSPVFLHAFVCQTFIGLVVPIFPSSFNWSSLVNSTFLSQFL